MPGLKKSLKFDLFKSKLFIFENVSKLSSEMSYTHPFSPILIPTLYLWKKYFTDEMSSSSYKKLWSQFFLFWIETCNCLYKMGLDFLDIQYTNVTGRNKIQNCDLSTQRRDTDSLGNFYTLSLFSLGKAYFSVYLPYKTGICF